MSFIGDRKYMGSRDCTLYVVHTLSIYISPIMQASYTWVGIPLDTSLLNELTKKCMNNSKAVFAFPDISTIFSTALKFHRQSHCFARILA